MERVLDGIERLGNKMPDPAILFLWLCLGVILLSQALAWLDVKATYQVVAPPPVPAEETYYGGSIDPVYVGPYEHEPADGYEVRTETTEVKGLLTVDGIRFLFTSFVDNFRNFAAVAIILVVMIGVGLAEAAGLIGALIRKLVAASSPQHAHVHHRAARHDLERRLRRGLHRADTPGGGGVPERRPPPDRRHRGRVRGRRRGLRGELPDHAAGRRADRDHQRRLRAGRPERGDRPRGEPVLRHRLGAVRHRAADVRDGAASSRTGCGTYDPSEAGEEPEDEPADVDAGGRGARPALRAVGDARASWS